MFLKKHWSNVKVCISVQKEQARVSPAIPLNVPVMNLIYEYIDSTSKHTLQAKVDSVQWSYITSYITACCR